MQNGKYRARALSWDLGNASTGTPQIGIDFEFLDHPGQTMNAFLYFTDETFDRTIEALCAMGWTGNDLDNITDLNRNEVNVTVKAELNPKTNQMEPKIQFVNSTGGVAMKQKMDEGQKKAFAAKFAGRMAQFRQRTGGALSQASGRPPV